METMTPPPFLVLLATVTGSSGAGFANHLRTWEEGVGSSEDGVKEHCLVTPSQGMCFVTCMEGGTI